MLAMFNDDSHKERGYTIEQALQMRDRIVTSLALANANAKNAWNAVIITTCSSPKSAYADAVCSSSLYLFTSTSPSSKPKYTATGFCPPCSPSACACIPLIP